MKGRIVIILLLLLLAIVTCSCTSDRVIHVEISCDTFSKNPTSMQDDLEIYIGDKIYLELCSNPSTGFEWGYKITGDKAIQEVGHRYQAPTGDVPGTPGRQTWVFKAVDRGNTEIFMTYSQPWDGGIKEKWTYKIIAVVKGFVLPSP